MALGIKKGSLLLASLLFGTFGLHAVYRAQAQSAHNGGAAPLGPALAALHGLGEPRPTAVATASDGKVHLTATTDRRRYAVLLRAEDAACASRRGAAVPRLRRANTETAHRLMESLQHATRERSPRRNFGSAQRASLPFTARAVQWQNCLARGTFSSQPGCRTPPSAADSAEQCCAGLRHN